MWGKKKSQGQIDTAWKGSVRLKQQNWYSLQSPALISIYYYKLFKIQSLDVSVFSWQHASEETRRLHNFLHRMCLPGWEFHIHFKGLWSEREKDDLSFFFSPPPSLMLYFWDLPDFSYIGTFLTTRNLSDSSEVGIRSSPKLPCRQSGALCGPVF